MKFTIITINYNNADGLRRTIESVVNQTYTDYEYVIIDGGSTDGSVDVIREYEDKITYWVSEKDKGIYNAMNKGVKVSHGDYLIFMNSGDCFFDNNVLSAVINEAINEDIVTGKFVNSDTPDIIRGLKDSNITFISLYDEFLCHQATFFKRTLFKNRLYDETFKLVADWKFYTEVLVVNNGTFRMLNSIIAYFDSTGVSQKRKKDVSMEQYLAAQSMFPPRILEDYKKYKAVQSSILSLIPEIRDSAGFANFVYRLLSTLIKMRKIAYKVIGKKQ